MKYTFIGDCHGKTEKLLEILATQCNESDFVLQLGDMGLGFKGVFLPSRINKTFGFIRGNHDSPDHCQMHDRYAKDYGVWNGVFLVGGAYSIDYAWRTPGESWWPGEQLSKEDGQAAYELYVKTKPRVVATHEAPKEIGEALLRDGGFRPEKWGSTESRTAKLLQDMWDAHKPEHWFFGHYHRDWELTARGTKFNCLNELAVKHLDVNLLQ